MGAYTEVDLAWAAGLFEGEGCCSGAITPEITVQIGMTDEAPVRTFRDIVNVGHIYGPLKRSGNKKAFWLWRVRSWSEAQHVFDLIGPWLYERRLVQFESALARRPLPLPAGPPCGRSDPLVPSTAGYSRHMYRKETPCADCREAHRLYNWSKTHAA